MDENNTPLVSVTEVFAPETIVTPCEYARERHRNILMWRNLWTILLFVFGSVLVLSLIVIVAFILLQHRYWEGAVCALGTVVSGAAVKWIVERRQDAKNEEEEAYRDVEAKCGAPALEAAVQPAALSSAKGLRERYRLFGRWL